WQQPLRPKSRYWQRKALLTMPKEKGRQKWRPFLYRAPLQRTLNFKTPGFQQRFGDILAVFIAPCPFAQTSRSDVLIRRQLELLDCLFKRCHHGDNWPDGFGLAPVRITASPCHSQLCPAF